MDQVTAVTGERHLEGGAIVRMTHAATNTTGSVGQIRPHSMTITTASSSSNNNNNNNNNGSRSATMAMTKTAGLSSSITASSQHQECFSISSPIRETITEAPPTPIQTPKKKRGPKAGRKAALALAAAAAAAAAAASSSGNASASSSSVSFGKTWTGIDQSEVVGPATTSTTTMKPLAAAQSSDPYAFNCNDAMTPSTTSINYETIQNQTETTFNDRRFAARTGMQHQKHERFGAKQSGISRHHNINSGIIPTSDDNSKQAVQHHNTYNNHVKLQNNQQQQFRQNTTPFKQNEIAHQQHHINDDDSSCQLNEISINSNSNNRFQHFQATNQQNQRQDVFDYNKETELRASDQSVQYQYQNSNNINNSDNNNNNSSTIRQLNKQQYVTTFKRPSQEQQSAEEEPFHMIAHKQHPIAAVAQPRKTLVTTSQHQHQFYHNQQQQQQQQSTTQMHHHNHSQQQHVVVNGGNVQQQAIRNEQQQYYQQQQQQQRDFQIGNQINSIDQQPPQSVYQAAEPLPNRFAPTSHQMRPQIVENKEHQHQQHHNHNHHHQQQVMQHQQQQSQKPQIQAQLHQQYHLDQQQAQPQVPPPQQLPYHHQHQHQHNQHQQPPHQAPLHSQSVPPHHHQAPAQYEQQPPPITHHQPPPLPGQHYQSEQVHIQRQQQPLAVPQPVPAQQVAVHHQPPPPPTQLQPQPQPQSQHLLQHQNPMQQAQRIAPYQATSSGNLQHQQQSVRPICSSTGAITRPGTINQQQAQYRAQSQQQQQPRCIVDSNPMQQQQQQQQQQQLQQQHIQPQPPHQIPSQHQHQQLVSPNLNSAYSGGANSSYLPADISQTSFQLHEQEQVSSNGMLIIDSNSSLSHDDSSNNCQQHQHQQYPSSSPTLLQQQLNRQSSAQTQAQHQQRLGPVVSGPRVGPTVAAPNASGYKAGRGGVVRGFNSEPNMISNEPVQQQQQQHNFMEQHNNSTSSPQTRMMNPISRMPMEGSQAQVLPPQQPSPQTAYYQAPRASQQQQRRQIMPASAVPPPSNIITDQHQTAMLGNPTPPLTPISASVQQPATTGGGVRSTQSMINGQPTVAAPPNSAAYPSGPPQSGHSNWPQHHHDHHVQASNIVAYNNGQQMAMNGAGPPKQGSQTTNHNHHLHQQLQDAGSSNGPTTTQVAPRLMPKNQQLDAAPPTGYHPHQAQYQQHATVASTNKQQHLNQQHLHHQQQHINHQTPASQLPGLNQMGHSLPHHQMDMPTASNSVSIEATPSQTRLTLPLSDAPVLGPFRLDHDAQFTSKVFHIKPQLFDALSKSMNLINPQTASVIQELQFRAYLIKQPAAGNGDSLLAASVQGRACNWPELFQVSVNQNILNLERSKSPHSGAQKAIDVFQFCQLGNNVLDIQVNDCYCSHEFILEAIDRPTIKAFMSSCFKSRLLSIDGCIQKLKFNFNTPGFLIQNQQIQQNAGIINEYVIEFNQGIEITKTRISLRCPISCRRMRTPTRGQNCKHLQCFDLEKFLFVNRERSQWHCPICPLSIPFNMLELDQHQMNIIQAMSETLNTDDILMDSNGQWQAYFVGQQQQIQKPVQQVNSLPPTLIQQQQQQQQPALQSTAKSTGTYHPQAPIMNGTSPHHQQHPPYMQQQQQQPMRPMSGSALPSRQPNQVRQVGSPASWDGSNHIEISPMNQPQMTRGPASVPHLSQPAPGRRSANGSPLAKKPYTGQYAQRIDHQPQTSSIQANYIGGDHSNNTIPINSSPLNHQQLSSVENSDDLSPLAAMERTIIQHEQQMGPPPFDPNSLTSSPAPLRTGAASSGSPISNQSSQQTPGQQQQQQSAAATPTGIQPPLIQASPDSRPQHLNTGAFSPTTVSSPASRMTPAISSPQQARPTIQPSDQVPQSPMQQQQLQQAGTSISTPATPSSTSMLIHGGPETPATPSQLNTQQHSGGPNSVSAINTNLSPHISSNSSSGALSGGSTAVTSAAAAAANTSQLQQQQATGVDHQPLSNGSASAGSITSTSTMTPSGQSLGSVGMGGDSRCGTAPLQGSGPLGLDDLMLPGGGSSAAGASTLAASTNVVGSSQYNSASASSSSNNDSNKHSMLLHNNSSSHLVDEKNDILMGKLMMDSSESLLRDHRNSELAIALEEAEWKQQLDRGKSEHLANFLNEPLMNTKHNANRANNTYGNHHNQQQHQSQQQMAQLQDSNKLISGGLNPSDDEANQSHNSSPSHNLDQLEFANYLDSDTVDNGAGLPPDDSILDLFER